VRVREGTMRNQVGCVCALVTMLTVAAPVQAWSSAATAGETFTWLAELVSVDPTARTMTVKARVAYQEALSEVKQFKAGDAVWVVWSGVSDSSDAVREFQRVKADREISDKRAMRAELVSPEPTNQSVTLRVTVPDAVMPAIKSLKPGEWVRATSPQRPSPEVAGVVGVRAYNDLGPATSTTH